MSFGNKTEFMAGGGEVPTGRKVGEGTDVAFVQKCESKAGKDSLSLAHKFEGDIKQTERDDADDEAINPELALFEDDYEKYGATRGNSVKETSPEPAEDQAVDPGYLLLRTMRAKLRMAGLQF